MIKKFVLDACSLIYLTKIQIKEKLSLLGTIIVSSSVKNEVITDIDKFPEVKIIKNNFENKIIQEKKLQLRRIPQLTKLGKGEKESIELCIEEGAIFVTDDHHALNYGLSHGLNLKTSEIILLDFLKEELITIEEFENLLERLALIKSLKSEIKQFLFEKAKEIAKKK